MLSTRINLPAPARPFSYSLSVILAVALVGVAIATLTQVARAGPCFGREPPSVANTEAETRASFVKE